ncbi:MAG: regulator of chromosome condensation [Myxococcaceae bacterium]|nr:regulator of chromosome condensation [Myxococcaceae bacterium]
MQAQALLASLIGRALVTLAVLFAWIGMAGCADESVRSSGDDEHVTGTLSLPLVAQSGGVTYRLIDAVFAIRGPIFTSVSTSEQTESTPLTKTLPVGQYDTGLAPGWRLQRQTASGWVTLDARVVNQPLTFFIRPNETAQVVFRFQTEDSVVDMGTGQLAIDIEVEVVAPPSQRAIKVALGGSHSCALYETGIVRCWGDGSQGQLGYGNTDSLTREQAVAPVDVGGGPVRDLALGDTHSCALLQTGAVRCWGANRSGQLGYGDTVTVGDDETPNLRPTVPVGGVVQQLTAGAAHTCALLTSGAVRCWGEGFFGQLGYGNTQNVGDDETPAAAGDVPVGALVREIAAKNRQTCALLEQGSARCWGANYYYDQQYGDNEPASAAPEETFDGDYSRLLAVGGDHFCVQLDPGPIVCRGSTRGHTTTDHLGTGFIGGPIARLVAGSEHNCALVGGEQAVVRCWGAAGRLGVSIGPRLSVPIAEAVTLPLPRRPVYLAAGSDSTCAVLDDGTIQCW